jgi:hypothetical protein
VHDKLIPALLDTSLPRNEREAALLMLSSAIGLEPELQSKALSSIRQFIFHMDSRDKGKYVSHSCASELAARIMGKLGNIHATQMLKDMVSTVAYGGLNTAASDSLLLLKLKERRLNHAQPACAPSPMRLAFGR